MKQPKWGESEALKNISPKPTLDSSYGSYVAHTAKRELRSLNECVLASCGTKAQEQIDYLKQIFPSDAANIQIVTANIEDREFRSSAIATKDGGQFSRELFKGTRGHETPEASVEALLYGISQQWNPSLSREHFDEDLKVAWQATQANKSKGPVIKE